MPKQGAVCGTSTVTTFVESSAGVAEGGRTGLSSMVTGALLGELSAAELALLEKQLDHFEEDYRRYCGEL